MVTLILLFPLLNFLCLLLFGSKLGVKGSNLFSCFNLFLVCLMTLIYYYDIITTNSPIKVIYWDWININLINTELSFFIDSMSATMILVVNMVSLLVHMYSISYMKEDPHSMSFMAYLSMFTFFMLVLISAQNYLQLFMGWEGVGLCSYLLMNFWYSKMQANKAAIKAMLVNSVGDIAFIGAMVLLWMDHGSMNFLSMFPICGGCIHAWMVPLLLLLGAMGKSAQLGLHSWLPDAMEGPTPVSALMHAATMVTAGVYLMISSSPLFEQSSLVMLFTTMVGSLTALFAATTGLMQNDMKKMMAYSTCSQLGFMTLSCGLSHYSLALFHLVNHAFFKALLFLGAGSMMHSLLDEQDLSKMGGILFTQPLSYMFIIMGSLSLIGFPFLSGYYSKDLLLEMCFQQRYIVYACWLGLMATLLTAFYSFKIMASVFLLHQNSSRRYWYYSHESSVYLLMPLTLLVVGSMFSGFILTYPTLNNINHPTLDFNMKTMPFNLSILGGLFGITLFIMTKYTWMVFFKFGINKYYQFFVLAWDFDKMMHKYILTPTMSFGYKISFKNFDTGLLEKLGPIGLSKNMMTKSSNLSSIQSGYLFNYAMLMILAMFLFIFLS